MTQSGEVKTTTIILLAIAALLGGLLLGAQIFGKSNDAKMLEMQTSISLSAKNLQDANRTITELKIKIKEQDEKIKSIEKALADSRKKTDAPEPDKEK